jgi:glyoxylase-like metal-dependent hydrolase (beta-lactamase superfamily II)
MFTCCRPFPGVTHITDAMGVSFTLIEGEDSALLFDAGYGTEDVAAYVRTLTDRPVELILSHGHHDHMLGARFFDHSLMDPADLEEFRLRAGREQREKVKSQAEGQKVPVPEDFLSAAIPEPLPIRYLDRIGDFDCTFFDLGGREVWLLHVPGHTAGSVVLYVPELQLLLTGDDWNPCTWMWFPCSLPAKQWRDTMLRLVAQLEEETGEEILGILCSHQASPREGRELKAFLDYMTDPRMQDAEKVDMGSPIDTRQVTNPEKGWVLLFDAEK